MRRYLLTPYHRKHRGYRFKSRRPPVWRVREYYDVSHVGWALTDVVVVGPDGHEMPIQGATARIML